MFALFYTTVTVEANFNWRAFKIYHQSKMGLVDFLNDHFPSDKCRTKWMGEKRFLQLIRNDKDWDDGLEEKKERAYIILCSVAIKDQDRWACCWNHRLPSRSVHDDMSCLVGNMESYVVFTNLGTE